MTNQSVSVIIPTFNGQQLLAKNLPAVIKCLRDGDELIIVDDASADNTVEWLEKTIEPKLDKRLNHFQLISNQHNLRFGASVNKVVQQAQHNLIFLINNDVSPHQDVLTHLVPHFSDSTVFAVGCLEMEHQAGDVQGGKNKLWFEKGLYVHSRADTFTAGATAWVSGGSGLYDKEKWLELGGFDKIYYPAYWEDIDLSFRARKKGWKVLFEPLAIVDHNHESTNADVFGQKRIEDMSWRNANRFVWRNGTVWQKIANLLWRPYWTIQRWRSYSNKIKSPR
jgi:GT2 family glycosyltransferase